MELKVERDHPGKTARYWREGDVIIVQIGRDLHPWRAMRLIQEARRAHDPRRRGTVLLLPADLGIDKARQMARDHPTTTASVTAVLALGVAAGAILGTTIPADEPPPRRRRPPAVAEQPSPSPSQTTPAPTRSRTRTVGAAPPSSGPSPRGGGDGPTPVAIHDRPDPTPTAPRPTPGGRDEPPPSTRPPATRPPTEPPVEPRREQCLLRLTALGLVDVRLLCAR